MPDQRTDQEILKIARQLLAEGGLAALSFDAIARRLGRSKQAVLYWYPTKQDLHLALFLPWLRAEADAAQAALLPGMSPAQAIRAFVRAVASFHLSDLDRFRLMYLAPQTMGRVAAGRAPAGGLEKVHPETGRLYDALSMHLPGTPDAARARAFAIHAAVLGQIMMVALADALGDPLKHSNDALTEALIASLRVD